MEDNQPLVLMPQLMDSVFALQDSSNSQKDFEDPTINGKWVPDRLDSF